MKRTLKRELKVPEIAKREANEPSHFVGEIPVPGVPSSVSECLYRALSLRGCSGFNSVSSASVNISSGCVRNPWEGRSFACTGLL